MNKKITVFSILLLVVLSISFSACGSKDETAKSPALKDTIEPLDEKTASPDNAE